MFRALAMNETVPEHLGHGVQGVGLPQKIGSRQFLDKMTEPYPNLPSPGWAVRHMRYAIISWTSAARAALAATTLGWRFWVLCVIEPRTKIDYVLDFVTMELKWVKPKLKNCGTL